MTPARLPPGYGAVPRRAGTAFAWEGAIAWATTAIEEAGTLYDWAERHALESRAGRGPVHVIEAVGNGPEGAARWAVRRYRRGGAVAPLLGDRYWGVARARPERELDASQRARASGVRTPAVVAGAVYRRGPSSRLGFYRADLVTEHVPRARTLASTLIQGGADPCAALRAAGAVATSLERAGVLHPDLNARNVLFDEAGEAWALDLDRARRLTGPSPLAAESMVRRLERSLRKLEGTHGRRLSHEEWAALRAGLERS